MANLPVIEQEVLIRFKADTKRLKKGAGDIKKSMKGAAKEMSSAAVAGEQIGRIGSALPGQLGPLAGSVGALTGAFRGANGSMLAFGLGIAGIIGGIIKFLPDLKNFTSKIFEAKTALDEQIASLEAWGRVIDERIKKSSGLVDALFPEEAAQRMRAQTAAAIEQTLAFERLGAAQEFIAERAKIRRAEEKRQEAALTGGARQTRIGDLDPDLAIARAERAADARVAAAEARAAEARKRLDVKFTAETAKNTKAIKASTKSKSANTNALKEQAAILGKINDAMVFGIRGPGLTDPASGGVTFIEPGAAAPRAQTREGASVFGGGRAPRFPVSPDQVLGTQEKQLKAMTDAMTDFGTATEQVAEHLGNFESAFGSAFEAFGRGDMTLKEAGLAFVKEGIGEVLRLEAKKQFALGVAAAITLSPKAALHFAASAGLYGAAGAIDGRGGGSGGSGSGGRLAGAAAGSFNGQGNAGGGSSETIIIGTISDNPRRQRRDLQEMMDRSAMESGPGLRIERR